MKKNINICGLNADSGKKVQGFVNILDTDTKMPVTIINGQEDGNIVLLTAGIHGAEYPCIKTAIELAKEIEPKEVKGAVIIVHPVNTQAFIERRVAIVPEDNKNINRVPLSITDEFNRERTVLNISTQTHTLIPAKAS